MSTDLFSYSPEWMVGAVCAEIDPDIWFPERGGESGPVAQRICEGCDVRVDCLNFALDKGFSWGIWGGRTPRQRARILREAARRVA